MNNREVLLIKIMAIFSITVMPWYYLVEPQITKISEIKNNISRNQENLALIQNINIPTKELLTAILSNFKYTHSNGTIIVYSIKKSLALIHELEKYKFDILKVRWDGSKNKSYIDIKT